MATRRCLSGASPGVLSLAGHARAGRTGSEAGQHGLCLRWQDVTGQQGQPTIYLYTIIIILRFSTLIYVRSR